jgi:molecular chaperone DnaK
MPQIEVTFDIDANGIVNVTAKDTATGTEHNIVIKAQSGLSDDEIDRMVQEAEENREADEARRELAELRNEVDTSAWQNEKLLKEHSDKVDADVAEELTAAVAEARSAVEAGEKEGLEAAKAKLEEIGNRLAEKLYANAAADGGADEEEADEDVIDADFEETT